LLLFYAVLSTYTVAGGLFSSFNSILSFLITSSQVPSYSEIFFLAVFMFNSTLSITLTVFFKFHIKLALNNSTTIEAMDKKKVLDKRSSFDRGVRSNWEQVFGRNKWTWVLPLTGESGKPIGDGVIWSVPGTLESEEVPVDEIEKRNSSTYEEHKKIKTKEDLLKDLNTAPDTNRLRMELKKPFAVHAGQPTSLK